MRTERHPALELDPAAALAPQVARALRERIIRNDLRPGDRISESGLARGYGVSRQPVREALIKLAGQGLVEVRPQRGTIVARIGYAAVLDARFLREAIEADIAKILAARPGRSMVAGLRGQLARQDAADRRDPGAFIRLDDAFHRALAGAAGKAGAWRQIEGLKSQMDRVRHLSLGEFRVEALVRQHREIVDQIESGGADGAERAIRRHLREVLSDLPRIVEANRASFDLPGGDMPPPVNTPLREGENA